MSRTSKLAAEIAGRPPLQVDANLDVAVDGHPMTVTGEGNRLTVAIPSFREALAVTRGAGGEERLRAVGTLATAAGLTADVTVHGRTVARTGRDASPGTLGRRFGVELRPKGILSAAVAGLRARVS